MTNEEAIELLEDMDNVYNQLSIEDKEAIDMAIEALKIIPEHHGRLLILDENLVKQNLVPFDCSNNLWLNEVALYLSAIGIIPATGEGATE